MTTFIQLLLAIVISTLTFLVALAGVQVFHLLHELRLALKKFNRILDHTQALSETAARPITAVNDFYAEVKDLVNQTQDKIIDDTQDKVIPVHQAKSSRQRFFRRSGLPLRPS